MPSETITDSQPSGDASYFYEPAKRPFVHKTFHALLTEHAAVNPTKEAFVFRPRDGPRQAITYGELDDITDEVTAGLISLGLKRGDFVGIVGLSTLAWPICELAASKAGCASVRISFDTVSRQSLVYALNTLKCKALLYTPTLRDRLAKAVPELFEGEKNDDKNPFDTCTFAISSSMDVTEEGLNIGKFIQNNDVTKEQVQNRANSVDADDIFTVFMTSGSSGVPKCVPMTHFNLVNVVAQCYPADMEPYSNEDKFFCERPYTWSGAYPFFGLVSGITYVHVETNISNAEYIDFAIDVMAEEGVTGGVFPPYILHDLIRAFEEKGRQVPDNWNLRWGLAGGECVHPEIYRKSMKYIPYLLNEYGTTENFELSLSRYTDPLDTKLKYTGRVAPSVEIKIVDCNNTKVPFGQMGEICVRSPMNFSGYLGLKAGQSVGMELEYSGWCHTGDNGWLSKDGFVVCLGRECHEISRGTRKIQPLDVENKIIKHPNVAITRVIGVPDPRLRNEICACVIPVKGSSLTVEELREFVEGSAECEDGMALNPKYYLFCDAFPTKMGKMDPTALKKYAIEKLNLEQRS